MLRQYYANSSAESLFTQAGVLAVISFDGRCEQGAVPGAISAGLSSLSGHSIEVIEYTDQMAERGTEGGCQWSCIRDIACVATWLPPEECSDIRKATEAGYNRLLEWINGAGYPYPFRIWNFVPGINDGTGDSETYKQFCVGRQRAFDRLALSKSNYPAASAVGHHTTGGVIYMLTSRHPSEHHENPKQQPAYHYPRAYGPCSPSFARATSVHLQHGHQIMISGTASILGHNTQAAGDLQQQLAITLENIHCLQRSIDINASELSGVRVYLRHAEHYTEAEAYLSRFIARENLNFVHADICRANLLVEVEAMANKAYPK